jgi:hypothetical protein
MNGGGKPNLRVTAGGEIEGTVGRTVQLTAASADPAFHIKIAAATYKGNTIPADTLELTIAAGVHTLVLMLIATSDNLKAHLAEIDTSGHEHQLLTFVYHSEDPTYSVVIRGID